MSDKQNLKEQVEVFVQNIPSGRVMTYGQLAALSGNPQAARVVGGIAHFGNPELPWHRVVNKQGGLASGYPGGKRIQGAILASEGIELSEANMKIDDIDKYIWWP